MSAPADPGQLVVVPGEHVLDEPRPAVEMIGNRTYFEVDVNEIWLTLGRKWLQELDPMVYVITEFEYDGESHAAPFVVGPQLISRNVEEVPGAGMRFTDTRVAGPHPFHGHLGLAVVLCSVVKDDHARDILHTMETAVKAIDFATAVVPYLKLAEVVLQGVNSLSASEKVRPVVSHRTELDYRDGLVSPLYFALVASADADAGRLWVRKGRLEQGPSPDDTSPFRDTDFVLFRVAADVQRDDVDRLPFAPVKRRAYSQAGRAILADEGKRHEDPLWHQAKATLFNLWQEALDSPDLVDPHVDQLKEEWRTRMLEIRAQAERQVKMGPADDETAAERLQRKAAAALDI